MNLEKKYFTNHNTVDSDRIIYTPSPFARSSLLYLQETGNLQALKPHVSSRSALDSYLFIMVNAGQGELDYGDTHYELKAGDCVFVDCSEPYSHCTREENAYLWNLSWVHFNGSVMKEIYKKYLSRGGKIVFHPKKKGRYIHQLEILYEEAASSSYVRDMKINCILSELLSFLMEDAWDDEKDDNKRVKVKEIKKYLEDNYASQITLDSLAEHFFINKFYLSEVFKEQYGYPVMDYVLRVRTNEAKKLLRFTEKTMEEIAEEVGVNGAAYFSRMFKKVEGMSPNEYRKKW